MLTKEQVRSSLSNWFEANSIEAFDTITDEQWQVYCDLIDSYASGKYCDCGWQWLIESKLIEAGCSDRLSFVLSVVRDDVAKAESVGV